MVRVKTEDSGISAFERKRLENIAANQALLRDLSTTASKIDAKAKPKPAAPRAPRKKTTAVKRESPRPTRTSSRLAGIEADSEVAKRKADDELELEQAAAKAKRLRVGGDLDLRNIVVEGKSWNKNDNFLSDIMRGAMPYERTFDEEDIKETTDEGLKALREKMSGLELYESYEPNRKSLTSANWKAFSLGEQKSKLPLSEYTLWDFIPHPTSPLYSLATS
jgi:hypothetical protein